MVRIVTLNQLLVQYTSETPARISTYWADNDYKIDNSISICIISSVEILQISYINNRHYKPFIDVLNRTPLRTQYICLRNISNRKFVFVVVIVMRNHIPRA